MGIDCYCIAVVGNQMCLAVTMVDLVRKCFLGEFCVVKVRKQNLVFCQSLQLPVCVVWTIGYCLLWNKLDCCKGLT